MKEVSEIPASTTDTSAHLRIEAAVLQWRDKVRAEITAELRKELEAEFDDRVRALTVQWQAEREKLISENQELRSLSNGEETKRAIEETEAALAGLDAEIQAMLNDENAQLSMVIQKRAQKSDIESYLRGLRFRRK